jgi:hypothetical protein
LASHLFQRSAKIAPVLMKRIFSVSTRQIRAALATVGAALFLFGCSSSATNNLIDSVPNSIGGLPANAPERSAEPIAYPAVHDMPPPRTNTTLSAEEQVQLEKDLAAVRARQEVITGVAPAKRTPQPPPPPPPRISPASSSSTSIY